MEDELFRNELACPVTVFDDDALRWLAPPTIVCGGGGGEGKRGQRASAASALRAAPRTLELPAARAL